VSERFFDDPILNTPYEIPALDWELVKGIPTLTIVEERRRCDLMTPAIPKPKKRGCKAEQKALVYKDEKVISTDRQQYDVSELINSIRYLVGEWRTSSEANWRVTPETARLLKHWRHLEFRAVAVMACDEDVIPSTARIEAITDDSDLDKVYATERHLLNVACTRAHDHLLISSGGLGWEFLEDKV